MSFFFIRWTKERERMEMIGMTVGLLLLRSLVGAKHHYSRWACRKTSVFATRLCYQEGWAGLLFWPGLFVWSLIGSIQFLFRGSMFFLVARMRKEWGLFRQSQRWIWFDRHLSCLAVFTPVEGCCVALGDSLLVASNRREVWVYSWDVAEERLLLLEPWPLL